MRITKTVGGAGLALVVLTLFTPATFGADPPLNGNFVFTHTITPLSSDWLWVQGTFSGKDHTLHAFTGTGSGLFYLPTFTFNGAFEWTFTSDGSTLEGFFTAQDTTPAGPYTFNMTLAFTILGGTGSLEGAIGQASGAGIDFPNENPPPPATVTATYSGSLSLPH